ncbi:MAG: hypothetical protein IT462_14805 [Planctomycetes bacterium]|nr:hypothetical protein [Planctomycetota bacterium]
MRPARPDSSRVAERPSTRENVRDRDSSPRAVENRGNDRTAEPGRVVREQPRDRGVIERTSSASRSSEVLTSNRSVREGGSSRSGVSERSTLASTGFNRNSAGPRESIQGGGNSRSSVNVSVSPFSGVSVTTGSFSLSVGGVLGGFYYSSGSYCNSYYRPYSYGGGFGCGSNVYYGPYATAYLVGSAVYLSAYHNSYCNGYPGTFNWGCNYYDRGCYYSSWNSCYRSYHTYRCGPSYCRVHRPYWSFCPSWYAYYPSYYGYYRYAYDELVYDDYEYDDQYDDGFDSGYDKGYKRGYGDGADDASAYKDDRRRDKVAVTPRAVTPDPDADREYKGLSSELAYELSRGHKAFRQGDYDTALKAYKEAVILEPNNAGAKYRLALGSFAAGKYSFGAFAVRRAIAVDVDSIKAVPDLRESYSDDAVFKAHLKALSDEAAKNADDGDVQLLLGFTLLYSGDARGATAPLEAALKVNPQDAAAKALYAAAMDKAEGK